MPSKRSKIGYPKRKKTPPQGDSCLGSSAAKMTTKLVWITKKTTTSREVSYGGFSSQPPGKKPQAHPSTTAESAKKQTLAVSSTRDLL